jgi:hypothetical protein
MKHEFSDTRELRTVIVQTKKWKKEILLHFICSYNGGFKGLFKIICMFCPPLYSTCYLELNNAI